MKVKWIKFCQWLLGVLGISATIASCDSNIFSGHEMTVEYGMPTMDYSVKGKVVDAESGKAVAGIEVTREEYGSQIDTTKADGSFAISGTTFPTEEFTVKLRDIDLEKDGAYKSVDAAAIQLQQVKKGDGNWYHGEFKAEDVVLKIEKQEE